jgi:hypothetical protein
MLKGRNVNTSESGNLFSHNLTAAAMWAEFHRVILDATDCYVPY